MTGRFQRIVANRVLLGLVVATMAAGPFLLAFGLALGAWRVSIGGSLLVTLGLLPWFIVTEKHVLARRQPVNVVANASGLWLDLTLVAPAVQIVRAVAVPNRGRKPTVQVQTHGQRLPVEVETETWDQAEAIVEALGWAPSERSASFTTMVPWLAKFGPIFATLLTIPALVFLLPRHLHDPNYAMAVCLAAFAGPACIMRLRRRVEVHPDRLVLSFLRRARTVLFSDVTAIERFENGAIVTLRSGEALPLRSGILGGRVPTGQRSDDALSERAAAAYEATLGGFRHDVMTEVARVPEVVGMMKLNRVPIAVAVFSALVLPYGFLKDAPYHLAVLGVAASALIVAQIMFVVWGYVSRSERVVATPKGITIGNVAMTSERIESGHILPPVELPLRPRLFRMWRVVFQGRRRLDTMTVVVPTEAEANALLRAALLDSTHTAATFKVMGGFFENAALQYACVFVSLFGSQLAMFAHGSAKWVIFASMGVAMLNALWPMTVKVGSDGVFIKGRRTRFYAYGDIASLEPFARGVVLVLKSGQRVEIRTTTGLRESSTRDAMAQRMQEGLARARHASTSFAARLLVERERPTPVRIAMLRALASGQAEYRAAAVDAAALWGVIEDESASPEARACAAAALEVDVAAATRLRDVARRTVSPALRAGLEAAASGDDARLGHAIRILTSLDAA